MTEIQNDAITQQKNDTSSKLAIKKPSDSPLMRWGAMLIVSFTMMCTYFLTDVMSPLESMLLELGWTNNEYGFFSGAYGYINVFLLMLFFGGIILDKMGIRFTGILSTSLMLLGAGIKYFAIKSNFGDAMLFGMHLQVVIASFGFAIFGMGAEITGITVTKILVKWFTGKELALAMGIQVGLARLGTSAAMACSLPLATKLNDVSSPILLGLVAICIGFIAFLVYVFMDKKEDAASHTITNNTESTDEQFHFSDLKIFFNNRAFWLITFLCLMFYSGVFPFLKFATKLMMTKYEVPLDYAGSIPSLIPIGTIFLTPLFGSIYDRLGKGATLMIIGSIMLTIVHCLFALPILPYWWFAIIVMIILGIAFSLVPSAMWPSIPKIIPMKQLGSAYSIIFFIQNIGLSLVPVLIGRLNGSFDYSVSMSVFALFGACAILLSTLLLIEDKKKNYGLQQPNVV